MLNQLTALLALHIADETARQAVAVELNNNPQDADNILQNAGVADDATRNGLVRQIQLIVANDADRAEFVDARGFVTIPELDARGFVTTPELDARGYMTADAINDWAANKGNPVVRRKGMMAEINEAIGAIPTPGRGWAFAALLLVFLLGATWFGSRSGFMSWGERQDEAIEANKAEVAATKAEVEKTAKAVKAVEALAQRNVVAIGDTNVRVQANTQAIGDLAAALANEADARRKGDRYSAALAKKGAYRACLSRGDRSDTECREAVTRSFGGKVSDATAKRWAKGLNKANAKRPAPAAPPSAKANATKGVAFNAVGGRVVRVR